MALPVDVEDHVAALGQGLLDRRARRAVAAAEHVGPFEQFPPLHERIELGLGAKEIVGAVALTSARGAGRDAD